METRMQIYAVARRDEERPRLVGWRATASEIRWQARPYPWRPPTDVFETDDAVVVRLEVAGMRPGDFQVALQGRTLTIRGVRYEESGIRAYHQMEIPFGEFEVIVPLPWPIQAEQVDASYQDGFLVVRLPKVRPVQVPLDETSLSPQDP